MHRNLKRGMVLVSCGSCFGPRHGPDSDGMAQVQGSLAAPRVRRGAACSAAPIKVKMQDLPLHDLAACCVLHNSN
jgi:hypothetical protein